MLPDLLYDDIYDPMSYTLPASVPELGKTFPVSWTAVKGVAQGDKVEYEVNVYELKPGQTPEEAVSENEALVSRSLTNINAISRTDTGFFKVFSNKKTYVMTLSTNVDSESNAYHFRPRAATAGAGPRAGRPGSRPATRGRRIRSSARCGRCRSSGRDTSARTAPGATCAARAPGSAR